jgi:2-aminoethylphosphonate-pyruvate transaminase
VIQRFVPKSGAPLLLLNPGPINVSQTVAESLLQGDLCHREPEFGGLQDGIRAKLRQAFAPNYAPILLTGSGTCALEAAVSSVVGPEETLLVLENGVYGDRLAKIASAQGIAHQRLTRDWTQPHDPEALAAALDANPEVSVVACVHHETTTGLLNPVRELAAVCRERGKTLILDAISAIGGEELDVEGWGVDVVVGTANKCVRGIPGISFVLLSSEVMERIKDYPPRTLYLHLPTYFAKQEAGTVPFTPAVQVAYALDVALDELLSEGVAARVAAHQAVSEQLRAGFSRLGLKLLLGEVPLSYTITTILLPEGWTYPALHDALREKGFVIYAGQGDLSQRAFRVSNMGVMDSADYERFLEALGEVLG